MNEKTGWVSADNGSPRYYDVEYKNDYAIICRNCFEQIPNDHRMRVTPKNVPPRSEQTSRTTCVCCGCDVTHEQLESYYDVLSDDPDDIYNEHDNIYEMAKLLISGLYQTEVVPTINHRHISSDETTLEHIRVGVLTTPQRSVEIAVNISHILETIGLETKIINAMDGMGNGQMIVIGKL